MSERNFLKVKGISKQFGGVRAVNNVSFAVDQGEILGLIGPNGAGKTTTFNLVSGRFPVTEGEVHMGDRKITGRRADKIAALGIARTFQGTRIFPRLSVRENVETAMLAGQRIGFWADWFNLPSARAARRDAGAKVAEVLEFVGLSHLTENEAGSLAYAHQSLLGLAMALSLQPRLLLLDEPFAGMNPRETAEAAAMVLRIRDKGITVVLVEHDMAAVMGTCDRIVVLDQGTKIAEGTPAEIRVHPRVIEAYLGTEEDA